MVLKCYSDGILNYEEVLAIIFSQISFELNVTFLVNGYPWSLLKRVGMTRNSSHTKPAENLINILVKYAVVGTSNHKKSSVNNACSTIKPYEASWEFDKYPR